MILLLSSSFTGTADDLVSVWRERGIPFFRFNTDLYEHYQFLWSGEKFEIIDPCGRICRSEDVDICVMYKCVQWVFPGKTYSNQVADPQYVTHILNELCGCLGNWAMQKNILRLWHPTEYLFPKTRQMSIAKKYFAVPEYAIHWGFFPESRIVIAKQIVQRPLDDGGLPFVDKVDRGDLDPAYPWFTQDIAPGNRDATVLYVNGRIHGFQFSSERGTRMDWRITQGTAINQWQPWDGGLPFEQKVDAFMKELGLKFGRLDFIIGDSEPQFLEVNARGQFSWLDDENRTLSKEVADAISDQSSTIQLQAMHL